MTKDFCQCTRSSRGTHDTAGSPNQLTTMETPTPSFQAALESLRDVGYHHHKPRGQGLHHPTEGGVVTARGPSWEGDCISLHPAARLTNTLQQDITGILYASWKDWRLQLFYSFQIDSLIKAQESKLSSFPGIYRLDVGQSRAPRASSWTCRAPDVRGLH